MNLKGDKNFEELDGFKSLTDIKDYLLKKNEEGYTEYFINYIKNFEKILSKRDKTSK